MRLLGVLMLTLWAASSGRGQAPLAAHWALDETSGLTASDGSGNGNHGTLTNFSGATSPWAASVFGNGLTFDGVDDHVACATASGLPVFDSPGGYTVTAWVNAPAQPDRRVFAEGHSLQGTGFGALFALGSGFVNNNRLRVYVRNDGAGTQLARESALPVFDGTWHHLAWVDHGDGPARLYVDGVLDPTDFSYTRSGAYTFDRTALGAVLRATTCCHLTGALDDVRAYPFPLTGTDVVVVMGNGGLGTGAQINQPGAHLDVDGVTSSPASAGRITVAQGAGLSLSVATVLGGFPWELVSMNVPAIPNELVLGPANTLNVSLATPSAVFANGFFGSSWGAPLALPGFPPTGYALAASSAFQAPSYSMLLTLQFAMIDPGAAFGVSLSGTTEIDIP